MKVNFKRSLVTLNGGPLDLTTGACPVCGRPTESKPATLRTICTDALTVQFQDERVALSGEDKMARYDLALKIMNEDVVDLTPEQLTLIRQVVAKMYSPLYSGQAWHMLDPKEDTDGS